MEELRKAFADLSGEFQEFKEYIKKNKLLCIVIALMIFFAYGFPLTNFTLSIDEENALFSQPESIVRAWGSQGRIGIVFIKELFQYWQANSVTSTFLAVTSLTLSSLVWAYIFNCFVIKTQNQQNDVAGFIFVILFLTFPAYSENIGFSMMSFELGIGWIAISLATLLVVKWTLLRKNRVYLFLGILLITFSISIYQSFLPVFVCGALVTTCLYFLSIQKSDTCLSFREFIVIPLKYILALVTGYIFYYLIGKLVGLFIPPSGYIDNFFVWGKQDPSYTIVTLLVYFKNLALGNIVFGSEIILPTLIACISVSLWFLVNFIFKKGNYMAFYLFLTLLCLLSMPFLMSIMLGSPMPIRANLVLGLFISSVWLLLYLIINKPLLKNIVLILIVIVSLNQSLSLAQLFYSDYNRYQDDVKLANQIGYTILNLNQGEKPSQPVVFVGSHTQQPRQNIIKQEVLGYSFFEWDGGRQGRKWAFMKSLGYDYFRPNASEIQKALKLSTNMPIWPYKGSVALSGNLIIVNLSDDKEKYKLDLTDNEQNVKVTGKSIYKINADKDIPGYFDLSISKTGNNTTMLKAGHIDPHISFPLFKAIDNSTFDYIKLNFESDTEGDMQFFLSQKNEDYSEEKYSNYISVKKGLNTIFCKKPIAMQNVGAIRIDPPNNSSIVLKSIDFIK
ncbi:glucosyltransferase domain-containing protein [Paenibacillus sp. S02]|uniref:glucosyltransferase domain-containing protein n=1 Tax=Paenibacillus sp. S02 TaxID=2823904 RepID=UPI001C653AAA|nr:glucosyltransferase domain-containing protein [Paenibacillus sp. S02]QYK69600.1 Glucosyl transferase GtrII [Paenibacillus sp. S02]